MQPTHKKPKKSNPFRNFVIGKRQRDTVDYNFVRKEMMVNKLAKEV